MVSWFLLGLCSAVLKLMPMVVRTMELNGATRFVQVPTKVRLVNYSWYAFKSGARLVISFITQKVLTQALAV